MTRTINYGLIGCGMMGQEHLHNIALLEGARVSAIHDPDPGMAKAAKTIAPDAYLATSEQDLLAVEDLTASLSPARTICMWISFAK